MPQEIHVGYRSRMVSAVAWLLMVGGVAAVLGYLLDTARTLAAAHPIDVLGAAMVACLALLALATGHALLRRHEWARRSSQVLLIGLMLASPLMPAVSGLGLGFVLPGLGLSLTLAWVLKLLRRPSVMQEFA